MDLNAVLAPLRRLDLERMVGLRPSIPPVAVEFDRDEMVLVRLRRRRGGATLESHGSREMPGRETAPSILRPNLGAPEEVTRRVRELFEATGTRPGRISVILPDNLAKVALISLPERPPSRKQLDELVRFRIRRSVPFRLDDAAISYQILPGTDRDVPLLVAIMLRSVVEQYEQVFETVGARPGLVDLSSLSLLNLCRREIDRGGGDGRDVALLNCARGYFTLIIVRAGRIVFFRCKTVAVPEDDPAAPDSILARELTGSMSYYQEKLGGQGIGAILVRTVSAPFGPLAALLDRLGLGGARPLDPGAALSLAKGLRLETAVGQRIAPALGAAAGRGD